MFRFTIRDLLFSAAIVGSGLGWWRHYRHWGAIIESRNAALEACERDKHTCRVEIDNLNRNINMIQGELKRHGLKIEWESMHDNRGLIDFPTIVELDD